MPSNQTTSLTGRMVSSFYIILQVRQCCKNGNLSPGSGGGGGVYPKLCYTFTRAPVLGGQDGFDQVLGQKQDNNFYQVSQPKLKTQNQVFPLTKHCYKKYNFFYI